MDTHGLIVNGSGKGDDNENHLWGITASHKRRWEGKRGHLYLKKSNTPIPIPNPALLRHGEKGEQ